MYVIIAKRKKLRKKKVALFKRLRRRVEFFVFLRLLVGLSVRRREIVFGAGDIVARTQRNVDEARYSKSMNSLKMFTCTVSPRTYIVCGSGR